MRHFAIRKEEISQMQSNRNRDVSSAFFPENKLFLSVPMCHSIADD